MAERITNATVQTGRRFLPLPWDSRIALLGRIRRLDHLHATCGAFDSMGVSGLVRIPDDQKAPLVGVLDRWSEQATVAGLPEGVWRLRSALLDDVRDAEWRRARGEWRPPRTV